MPMKDSLHLLPYQHQTVEKAVKVCLAHHLCYLALETRTGKTPVSLMTAATLCQEHNYPADVLFATKKSVMPSIQDTYERLRNTYPVMDKLKVEIVSFDSLHKVEFDKRIIIVDEAHSFGAFPKPALRAVQLRRLSVGNLCILLSATPTPESFSQVYHQLWACHFVSELIARYRNFYKWAQDYVRVKKKIIGANRQVNDYTDARIDLIRPYLDQITITQTQKDAGFAHPVVRELVYWVEAPDEIKEYVKRLKKDKIVKIGDRTVTADTPATLLTKTHQLYSGTVIPDDSDLGMIVSAHKLDAVHVIAKRYRKNAIYYTFIAEKALLIRAFGDRVTDDYQVFQSRDDAIFCGQYISKREGIDLKEADAIILFSPHYAYLSYIQTLNRMQHITRDKPPLLVWIFCRNGIEEKIYNVVKNKENYTSSHFRKDLRDITKGE